MQFSAGQDVRLKKLQLLKLFLSMAFKHGLLEGSTFLFQYSSMTRAPLESCRLGELKYAVAGIIRLDLVKDTHNSGLLL